MRESTLSHPSDGSGDRSLIRFGLKYINTPGRARIHQVSRDGSGTCPLTLLQFPDRGILLSHYRLFNALRYIAHVIIGHIRTGRQTEADLEELFLHTIGINIVLCIYRLLVHWLP